jgi:sRNA-binding regulator protein Hfq
MGNGKKPRQSPESEWFQANKGKTIRVWLTHPNDDGWVPVVGRLVWVDVYSVGVQVDGTDTTQMIYKHAISGIEPMTKD